MKHFLSTVLVLAVACGAAGAAFQDRINPRFPLNPVDEADTDDEFRTFRDGFHSGS